MLGFMARHRWHGSLVVMFLLSAPIIGTGSRCYVDLDDQDPYLIGHCEHERDYTRTRGGREYKCASTYDHCCASEEYCCNAAVSDKGATQNLVSMLRPALKMKAAIIIWQAADSKCCAAKDNCLIWGKHGKHMTAAAALV
eukprot:TRINITY_DN83254_c0_g1_i1.p1 TRINITY_DN83254_c0_g1~~TRINITY_DN83254_c0_g1_i1.p1  ORF type:complete len:140 (+),score=4.93 TRINITY_DN83254_c0_g1_i1:25-444(+)